MPTSMSASSTENLSQALEAAFKNMSSFSFGGGNVTVGGSGGAKSNTSSEATQKNSEGASVPNNVLFGVAAIALLSIVLLVKKG